MWSTKYKQCITCGSDERRYASKGLCYLCYGRKNRKKFNEKRKKYYKENREKCLLANKKWNRNNKDKRAKSSRKWSNNNKDWVKAFNKQYYLKNKEKLLEKEKEKYRQVKIGLLIRDEINKTPTKENKSLWNGIGLWNRDYDSCVECYETTYKHRAYGVCLHCYRRLTWQNMTERERKALYAKRKPNIDREKNKEYQKQIRKQAKKYIKLAKEKYSNDPKIKNLLDNI